MFGQLTLETPGVLAGFHPAVREWFLARFPEGPTLAQELGWPRVAAGEDTLIAAPTGSGKTLAGFLVCIDELYRAAERGEPVEGRTQVVYVSPLKALAVDIQQNLEAPLREITEVASRMGRAVPRLRAEVRSGDTPPSARAAMLRRPRSRSPRWSTRWRAFARARTDRAARRGDRPSP